MLLVLSGAGEPQNTSSAVADTVQCCSAAENWQLLLLSHSPQCQLAYSVEFFFFLPLLEYFMWAQGLLLLPGADPHHTMDRVGGGWVVHTGTHAGLGSVTAGRMWKAGELGHRYH